MKKQLREYNDLVFNIHQMLKDYFTYDELMWMPLRNLYSQVDEFKPRFKRIAAEQERMRIDQELKGKNRANSGPRGVSRQAQSIRR